MTLREWAQKWHVTLTYSKHFTTCDVPGEPIGHEAYYPAEAYAELHWLDDYYPVNFCDGHTVMDRNLSPEERAALCNKGTPHA